MEKRAHNLPFNNPTDCIVLPSKLNNNLKSRKSEFFCAASPLNQSDKKPTDFQSPQSPQINPRDEAMLVQVSQSSMCPNENPQLSTVSLGDNSQVHRQTCCFLRKCTESRTVNPREMPKVSWSYPRKNLACSQPRQVMKRRIWRKTKNWFVGGKFSSWA